MSAAAELIPATKAAAIVGYRDAALEKAKAGADLLARGHALLGEAAALAREAHGDANFHEVDHAARDAYGRLFATIDVTESIEAFRKHLDARTWVRIIDITGIHRLMDRTEHDKLRAQLATDVPEVSEKAIDDVISGLAEDATLIFQRGLARVFSDLDRRFRSHDAFKIGARMVLTHIFDPVWGGWNYHNGARQTLADVERVFAVLDGKEPNPGELVRAIDAGRVGHGPRQGSVESSYFRIHTFKNGNAHLWFVRDDLVQKANGVLADYYGAVLADAVPRETVVRSTTGALSTDLAFYASPLAVANAALHGKDIGPRSRVLEPSAGEGGLVGPLLATGAEVMAIEVDAARHAKLEMMARRNHRLEVVRANFLRVPAAPIYTHVLMNPPFSGTHWMEHVRHAFDFLRPGGQLVAILPATAELGTSRQHEAFRAWAATVAECRWRLFEDLPPESFASSGTRVQTVILRLRAPSR